jgi:CRP-like cAMP-binding protein
VVFFEGQASDTAFVMLRGLATVTYLDARHRRVLLAVIGPGELCGGGEAMPEALRGRLRCDAVQTCAIAALGYQRLVELLFGVSAGRFAAGTSLLFGTRDACLGREVLARGKSLRQRLLEVVGDLGARFGVPDARGVILDLPLTHEDLADLVGASRPKVTREIRLLESEGIMARQGRRLVIATKNS